MAVDNPWGAQDLTYPAEATRRAMFFGLSPGVKNAGDCAATAPGGMVVSISTGEAIVAGTTGARQGSYYVAVSSTTSVTHAGGSSSNPRIDVDCLQVVDANYAGSFPSLAEVSVIAGTASGSPVAPSLPASSLALVNVAVPQSAGSLVSGDLTDKRTFSLNGGGQKVAGNSDSGWLAFTYANGWANNAGAVYRLQGDKVMLRGTVVGGTSGLSLCTALASQYHAALGGSVQTPSTVSGGSYTITWDTAGNIAPTLWVGSAGIARLDGVTWTTD